MKPSLGAEIGELVFPELAGHTVEVLTHKRLGPTGSKIAGKVVRENTADVGRKLGDHTDRVVRKHGPPAYKAATRAARSGVRTAKSVAESAADRTAKGLKFARKALRSIFD